MMVRRMLVVSMLIGATALLTGCHRRCCLRPYRVAPVTVAAPIAVESYGYPAAAECACDSGYSAYKPMVGLGTPMMVGDGMPMPPGGMPGLAPAPMQLPANAAPGSSGLPAPTPVAPRPIPEVQEGLAPTGVVVPLESKLFR
ncbi:hypothetical protein [Tuwongella immobilis]|uniref:Lipoprotein n=1 Tax=Tuwongella immobilis TaxID=692036 RepID=A0A6C2YL04_9BACT|nr:hypothetical protein [Tuwongella immobilis]VIP01981.1 unnamed protein product [Tuwongella immobilis]VTS00030.1 unnamed protein product [Tuwongella immobilis]